MRPRSRNPIENYSESWRAPIRKKASRVFFFKKLRENKEKENMSRFSINFEFLVLTRKSKGRVLFVESSFRLSCVRPPITSYLGWNTICEVFSTLWSYDKMLIDWVREPDGKIFGSHSRRMDLVVLGLYVMNSSQILINMWDAADFLFCMWDNSATSSSSVILRPVVLSDFRT